MTKRYLIDTSIWVDLYEDRKGFYNEPLGDYALKILSMIQAKGDVIALTDLLIRELESSYSMPQINGLFKLFQKNVNKIIATAEQREEAKKIAVERNIPAGDALHAILARDNGLTLITRDKHFKQLEDISKHYKPEEII